MKTSYSYRSHEQVDQAINPFNQLSITKIDEGTYLAYSKLQGLARRARYLCHEGRTNRTSDSKFTYDKHFARAIRCLDTILKFMENHYKVGFPAIEVQCVELKSKSLKYFSVG